MCGIFGYAIPERAPIRGDARRALLTVLALANESRGKDSWGFFTARDARITKAVGRVSGTDPRALALPGIVIGHTRAATTGGVTEDNAHPWRVGPVVGAHNGIVYNHADLNRARSGPNLPVDSLHLIHALAERVSDFTGIRGYGALEWYDDAHPHRVYLARLREGSLAVRQLRVKGKDAGIVWSSDAAHVDLALATACLQGEPIRADEGSRLFADVEGADAGTVYQSTSHAPIMLGAPHKGTAFDWEDWRASRDADWDTRVMLDCAASPTVPVSPNVAVTGREKPSRAGNWVSIGDGKWTYSPERR